MTQAHTKGIDMLHGSLWTQLPLFALPLAATGILQQLFNAADVAVVGNCTGAHGTVAVAAVGANSPIIGLIVGFFLGISLGANVVIAYALGRGRAEAVEKAVHTAILLALVAGFAGMGVAELAAPKILELMEIPDEVFPYALIYLRIYLLGLPAILLYNFAAAIFRSTGDSRTPLYALFVACVLNVLLNLFFVLVMDMQEDGVALATVLANMAGAFLLLYRLSRTGELIRVRWRHLRIDRGSLRQILKIGVPAGAQGAVFSAANVVIQAAINTLGTSVIAASSVALNLELFLFFIINAFGQSCTTFVGQNFGARQIGRCRRILLVCLGETGLVFVAAAGLILLWGHNLLALFNDNAEVVELGYLRLEIIFVAYIFTVLYEIMCGYLRGFRISFLPALLTIIGVCVTRIVYVLFLFDETSTFASVLMVYPVSLAATSVLIFALLVLYRPGHRYAHREHRHHAA